MIGQIATITASLTTSVIAAGLTGCVQAARGRPAPRPVRYVHRTSEGTVQKLIVALRSEKARRAAAEAELVDLREQLVIAREAIDELQR